MYKKGVEIEFKDVDVKKGIVSGYFSSFNTKDAHGDVITPGAYKKTVSERGPRGKNLIKWLLDHNREKLLGKLTELQEDDYGLLYTGQVGRHTLAKDFLLMVEDGLINQHSIGFYPVKEKFDREAKVNYITEIKLLEGSSLQFLGANENTPVTDFKSIDEAFDLVSKLEKFVSSSNASDETIIKLSSRLDSLLQTIQPAGSTEEDKEPLSKSELEDYIIPLFKKSKDEK